MNDIAYMNAATEEEHKSEFKLNSRVSHGVSVVKIWEKIDRVLMALHCTW